MICEKCGYKETKKIPCGEKNLCLVCSVFAPIQKEALQAYCDEKIDWKLLETFRKSGIRLGRKKHKGMEQKAKQGMPVTRAPLGYSVKDNMLIANEDASRVHSLFKTFLSRKYSLNSLARNFSLSTNGLKKVLTNRTYLGEIKFAGRIYKAHHKPLISPEIFYAVQRKLHEEYVRPKRK